MLISDYFLQLKISPRTNDNDNSQLLDFIKQQANDKTVNVMILLPAAMPRSIPALFEPRLLLCLTQLTTSPAQLLLHHHVQPTT